MKSNIVKCMITTKRTDFDKKCQLVPELQREVPVMRVMSETLGFTAEGEPIVASEDFLLKTHPTTGKLTYSMHEESKTMRAFTFFDVHSFSELKGREITVLQRKSGWGFEYED